MAFSFSTMLTAFSSSRTYKLPPLPTNVPCLNYSTKQVPNLHATAAGGGAAAAASSTPSPLPQINPKRTTASASTAAATIFPNKHHLDLENYSPPTFIITPFASHRPSNITPALYTNSDADGDAGTLDEDFVEVYRNPFIADGSEFPSDLGEDDDAVYARFDMPGIGKDGVNIYVKKSTILIQGVEGKKNPEFNVEKTGPRKYLIGINLPPRLCKTDKIEAQMKDGVLRLVIPKITLEERVGVFSVAVN